MGHKICIDPFSYILGAALLLLLPAKICTVITTAMAIAASKINKSRFCIKNPSPLEQPMPETKIL